MKQIKFDEKQVIMSKVIPALSGVIRVKDGLVTLTDPGFNEALSMLPVAGYTCGREYEVVS